MKYGIRKPSIKKSLSAKSPITKAKKKYSTKKYTDPIGTAKKRAYNKVYNKTTVSVKGLGSSKSSKSNKSKSSKSSNYNYNNYSYDEILNLSQYTNTNELSRNERKRINKELEEDRKREAKEREERMKKIDEQARKDEKIFYSIAALVFILGISPFVLLYMLIFNSFPMAIVLIVGVIYIGVVISSIK